jgi:hypothetical protein
MAPPSYSAFAASPHATAGVYQSLHRVGLSQRHALAHQYVDLRAAVHSHHGRVERRVAPAHHHDVPPVIVADLRHFVKHAL